MLTSRLPCILGVCLASACAPVAYGGPPATIPANPIVATDAVYTTPHGGEIELGSGGLFLKASLPFATAHLGKPAGAVSWSLQGASATLAVPPDAGAPTPPPSGTSLAYVAPGLATLTARGSATPKIVSSIPVYSYADAEIGCDLRAVAGVAFDPGVAGPVTNATLADVYATAPVAAGDVPNPCANGSGFEAPAGSALIYHFPYGATLESDDGNVFSFEPATNWRDDFTAMDGSALAVAPRSVVVFKTAGGRIVKMNVIEIINGGAAFVCIYEVSDASGVYPY